MNNKVRTGGDVDTVPLINAVFCVDCETISSSPHDVCTVCGGHSLINLFRMLGGNLRNQEPQSTAERAQTVKYNLGLTVTVHEMPANKLNRAIESIRHLAEVCGDLEVLHLNVESVVNSKGTFGVA